MYSRHVFIRTVALASAGLSALMLGACASSGSSAAQYEEHYINHEVTAADLATAKSTAALETDSAVLWVNGMGCPLCASNIDRQLARLSGVSSVKVDLGQGKVWLNLKPGARHPSPARLGEAVEDAGFTLVKVEASPK